MPSRMARPRSSPSRHRFRGTKPEPDASRRSPATQRAILGAATRLVRRHGYNRVTIEAIAAEAGAGKQTIYRWWKTKPALFAELLAAPSAPPAGRGSLATRLARILGDLARESASPLQAQIRIGLLAEAAATPASAAAVRARLADAPAARLRVVLQEGQRAGKVRRNADIKMAADQLVAALWFQNLVKRRAIDRRFVSRLVTQTLRGLAAA